MNEVYTSKHSNKRCKERLGISKKNTQEIAKKAFNEGLHYNQLTGKLKKYISWLYESHDRNANNIIVYNRNIYIFKDTVLITIMKLPTEYYKIYDKNKKKVEEN